MVADITTHSSCSLDHTVANHLELWTIVSVLGTTLTLLRATASIRCPHTALSVCSTSSTSRPRGQQTQRQHEGASYHAAAGSRRFGCRCSEPRHHGNSKRLPIDRHAVRHVLHHHLHRHLRIRQYHTSYRRVQSGVSHWRQLGHSDLDGKRDRVVDHHHHIARDNQPCDPARRRWGGRSDFVDNQRDHYHFPINHFRRFKQYNCVVDLDGSPTHQHAGMQ